VDNIQYLDDLDVVQQLMMIKKENTTEYDAAVAYLEGLMGIDVWLGWKRANDNKGRKNDEGLRQFAMNMLH